MGRAGRKKEEGVHMSEITPGQPVPTFELPDERGRPWNMLERCAAGPVVLVFYRGDW